MSNEKFPKQEEHERTGGQHGTRNTQNEADLRDADSGRDRERRESKESEEAAGDRSSRDPASGLEDGEAHHRTG